jgi:glycosyltransferase involved in cell wall biosynthesis
MARPAAHLAFPSISVVICAYSDDRQEGLLQAIESVRMQKLRPVETIVVIDHNSDLLERVRQQLTGAPGVHVLANAETQGLSGARNTGVAVAQGDVVAFLDDDAVAQPEWLARLGYHYENPRVIGVGGAIEPLWIGGRPKSFPPEFDWVVGCTYRGHPETAGPVRNVIGANMSFRRSIFAEVGGFRSDIGRTGQRPLGCEETEFCLRATARGPGRQIVYEPAARVVHTVIPARGSWRYFLRRCYSEGLSKALVGRLAGSRDGLRTERAYVRSTLSRGVVANVADAITGGDAAALARALRIAVGLGATAAGYYVGTVRRAPRVG